LAYALAHYDDVDCDYLVSQIPRAAPDEVDNLVTALGHARDPALELLTASARQAQTDKHWPLISRLAIVALYLGDVRLASDTCRVDDRPDPGQRAIFVVEFPAWHGDLVKLAKPAREIADPALRSAICLGIGGIPAERLLVDELAIWKPMLSDWFQSAPDGATHGAAGWALRRLEIEAPPIPFRNEPEPPRAWFVNSVGMTLLKVDSGEFIRRDQVREPIDQKVRLTQPFFFAEREVNVGQFLQFLNDADCPDGDKAGQWPGINEIITPTPDYPVRKVDWYEAVMFCNWLSRREGRTACYERTGKKEKVKTQEYDAWRRIPDGTGYRLPTEAEWEYTCRAGAALDLNTPRDTDLVRKFALFQSPNAAPGGVRLPNAWGFFDMLGNAWEWCDDWNGNHPEEAEVTDPVALTGQYREARGGSWFTSGDSCRCSGRGGFLPNDRPGFRDGDLGFRVVLSSP
jgi:formylglycine-generating enzyme required for sulfatase activity